ncbi:DUF4433 domain-containing protein [Paenibacillus sp. LMG 31459]|uniref:DUF4433 domain-containing protein n=1 Tax=Paenibacillus phytohabitans TaxID=2654978 RepID=A0ABX1YS22_9BACL|nr:DarT ssDNA thymidine ADP-ribosyltransferase family protein [Paenibacillus phytohabitans]NOU83897.1 DUF4433 domain-containing protein [Paenibacillus phytohabitans]
MTTVKNIIDIRNITRLCHFTKSFNLPSILRNESGIIANTEMDNQIELLSKNDPLRLDGKEDYVCCSVQYPNTWYLRQIKEDPLFHEWVILLINPFLATLSTSLFCHRNAAAERGTLIQGGTEGFSGLFNQMVQGKTKRYRTAKMLPCCPTDDQAEVLIYKNISRSDILAVVVKDWEQARREKSRLSFIHEVPNNIRFIIAPGLFDISWSGMIRNGQMPEETLYREE